MREIIKCFLLGMASGIILVFFLKQANAAQFCFENNAENLSLYRFERIDILPARPVAGGELEEAEIQCTESHDYPTGTYKLEFQDYKNRAPGMIEVTVFDIFSFNKKFIFRKSGNHGSEDLL